MAHVQANIAKFYSKFHEFRNDGKYTDVTIECDNESFKCHRVALATTCVYFDRMFMSNFKEKTAEIISISDISATTFKDVLQFVYTGDVPISSANVCQLLQASNYFEVIGIEELCVQYIQKYKLPVHTTFNTYAFACQTNKQVLIHLLCNDIASNLMIFSKVNEFFDLPVDNLIMILESAPSSLTGTDEFYNVVLRWILHSQEERLKHIDKIINVLNFENISSEYAKFIFKMSCKSITSADVPTAIEPKGYEIIQERQREKLLYVYAKDTCENMMKVFSINSTGNEALTASDKIPIIDSNQWIRSIASENHLYCLHYARRCSKSVITNNQSFKLYYSPKLCSELSQILSPPPVIFDDVRLAFIQDNIYVYNMTLSKKRFVPSCQTIYSPQFTDEEIKRGMYLYNCEIDKWFPVPGMPVQDEDISMVVCDNILYTISHFELYSYDYRTGIWANEFGQNTYNFVGTDCCVLNGKIYACGGSMDGNGVLRYDPIAGTWEELTLLNTPRRYHQVISYSNKIWAMGNYIDGISNDLSIEVYDVVSNTWNMSQILKEVSKKHWNPASCTIVDCITF